METRRDNYNLYDLGYGKNLSRYKPVENIETKNAFSDGISASSIGSLGDGKHLEDLGGAAYLEQEDINIDDIINDRIDTSESKILDEWTFGQKGAFVVGTSNDGLSISPTGLLARKDGETTFTITSDGDATYKGDLAASQIVTGSLSVLRTEADVTADNPQNVDWLTDSGAMAKEDEVKRAKLGETIVEGGYLRNNMLDTKVAYISDKAMIGNAIIDEAHINSLSADDISTGTLSAIDIEGVNITGSIFHAIGAGLSEASIKIYGSESDYDEGNEAGWISTFVMGTDRMPVLMGQDGVGLYDDNSTAQMWLQDGEMQVGADLDLRSNNLFAVNEADIDDLQAGDAQMGIVDIDDLLVKDILIMNGKIEMNGNNVVDVGTIIGSGAGFVNLTTNNLQLDGEEVKVESGTGYLYV